MIFKYFGRLWPPLSFPLEMPKVNNLKTENPSPEQLARLLEAIEQDANVQAVNFIKLALFTEMRRGELFCRQWPDVDFERDFIHILYPKGGQDQKIPLNGLGIERDLYFTEKRISQVEPKAAGK